MYPHGRVLALFVYFPFSFHHWPRPLYKFTHLRKVLRGKTKKRAWMQLQSEVSGSGGWLLDGGIASSRCLRITSWSLVESQTRSFLQMWGRPVSQQKRARSSVIGNGRGEDVSAAPVFSEAEIRAAAAAARYVDDIERGRVARRVSDRLHAAASPLLRAERLSRLQARFDVEAAEKAGRPITAASGSSAPVPHDELLAYLDRMMRESHARRQRSLTAAEAIMYPAPVPKIDKRSAELAAAYRSRYGEAATSGAAVSSGRSGSAVSSNGNGIRDATPTQHRRSSSLIQRERAFRSFTHSDPVRDVFLASRPAPHLYRSSSPQLSNDERARRIDKLAQPLRPVSRGGLTSRPSSRAR
jgi:hypothetical protein